VGHDGSVASSKRADPGSARVRKGAGVPYARVGPALVIAHRGDSAARAEHTLDAYRVALETGADGLECDVRLTKDGHLVCVHDRTIDRTSNGRGVVSDLDLDRLERLDFGSWHDRWPVSGDGPIGEEPYLAGVVPDVDARGRVLRLDALLELVTASPRPVRMFIETKHPTRYAGLVEKELVRTLRRFGLVRPDRRRAVNDPGGSMVTVMSFAPTALRRVRLLAPTVPTVLLMHRVGPARRTGDLPTGTSAAGPGITAVRAHPKFVARAHKHGHLVYVWTVDDPVDIAFVLDLGVDAVISNNPGTALRVRTELAEKSSGDMV
jgi:glycerophosphoryl diester phosphodiesterase